MSENYLEKALESHHAQTYPKDRVIKTIVLSNSPDRTDEIAQRDIDSHPDEYKEYRLLHTQHEKPAKDYHNPNVANAYNESVQDFLCTEAEIWIHCDSDVVLRPDNLKRIVQTFQIPSYTRHTTDIEQGASVRAPHFDDYYMNPNVDPYPAAIVGGITTVVSPDATPTIPAYVTAFRRPGDIPTSGAVWGIAFLKPSELNERNKRLLRKAGLTIKPSEHIMVIGSDLYGRRKAADSICSSLIAVKHPVFKYLRFRTLPSGSHWAGVDLDFCYQARVFHGFKVICDFGLMYHHMHYDYEEHDDPKRKIIYFIYRGLGEGRLHGVAGDEFMSEAKKLQVMKAASEKEKSQPANTATSPPHSYR